MIFRHFPVFLCFCIIVWSWAVVFGHKYLGKNYEKYLASAFRDDIIHWDNPFWHWGYNRLLTPPDKRACDSTKDPARLLFHVEYPRTTHSECVRNESFFS